MKLYWFKRVKSDRIIKQITNLHFTFTLTMSTKIDETQNEPSKDLSKKMTEKVEKSSTETTDENSSKRKSTHIWAAKDPWSGKPEEDPKNSKV